MRVYLANLLFLLLPLLTKAQTPCSTPGQNPGTAFPVCGTSSFSQATVPLCGGRRVGRQACGAELTDVNPFWYKFTCFQSGSLGFVITPNSASSDYDWALYDITGRDPNEVYTSPGLTIAENWSGDAGLTGTSAQGSSLFVCDGFGRPRFSAMPQLETGHQYLLLISHFTNSQAGYSLSFGGGTAVITDTTLPRLRAVEASCGGDILRVKLNKRMLCRSLTGNGSEFVLSPAAATVVSARGFGCAGGFDTDSVELRLSTFLNPGTYTLAVRKGSDNNTLLDVCGRPLPEGDSLRLVLLPRAPTPMDSLAPVSCAPRELRLLFRRNMLCNTVAPNGSDFRVEGAYPVNVTAARALCTTGNDGSKEIVVTLDRALQREGAFRIILQRGNDGNTLFDECGEETPAGAEIPFSVLDTVNAGFSWEIGYGCQVDTVRFRHPGGNRINRWTWALDERQQSDLQNPVAYYRIFPVPKTVQLVVSNGFCSDTAIRRIELINFLQASFDVLEDQCPNEPITIRNQSIGRQMRYNWTFGDGQSSTAENPSPVYATPARETAYWITLNVTDSFGCTSQTRRKVLLYTSCYVAVPSGFTPNNDGKNDRFRVLNAVKAVDFEFVVYNRWGQAVFRTRNWKEGWDGRVSGLEQNTGVFVWFLRYTDRDTGRPITQKGTVTLIR